MIPANSPIAQELGVVQAPEMQGPHPRNLGYTAVAVIGGAVVLAIITAWVMRRNEHKLGYASPEEHGSSDAIEQGAWLVGESINKIDNTPIVSLTKVGANGTALIIRCAQHHTEAFVATSTVVESGSVRIRFDDSVPVRQTWTESTSNTALFAPDAVTFARKLESAKFFLIEFTPFEESPRTLNFEVSNLGSNLQKISESCDWPSVDRGRATSRAAHAALRARVLQYVHSCEDQEIGKWCWSDPDDILFKGDNGYAETREKAGEDAIEYARMGLVFKGRIDQ